jgi:hypothetical protein
VNQIKRYEAGTAQPTLEALVPLAKARHLSSVTLVFDEAERDPSDDLEAVSHMPDAERRIVKALLDGMIIKYQTRQMMGMTGLSKSQVSRLCEEIDERVQAFLQLPLERDWPYLWIDANYVKARPERGVVSPAPQSAELHAARPGRCSEYSCEPNQAV